MATAQREVWAKGYRIILPGLFTIAFLIVGGILYVYFVNLPEEKEIITDPNSILITLNTTDKAVKLVKVTFPEKPNNATYQIEGPGLENLLDLETKALNDKEHLLYILTTSFPQNFSNQTYEGLLRIGYYSDSGEDKSDLVQKLVDLTLVISKSQTDLDSKANNTTT